MHVRLLRFLSPAVLAAAISFTPAAALAQTTTATSTTQGAGSFQKVEAVATDDGKLHGSVTGGVGFLMSAGNTFALALGSEGHLEMQKQKNRFRLDFVANVGMADSKGTSVTNADGTVTVTGDQKLTWGFPNEENGEGETNTFHLEGGLRYDRFLNPRTSLYVLGGAFHDPFQQIVIRPHGQIGISREFVNKAPHLLVGEFGFDYALEMYKDYMAQAVTFGTNPTHIFSGRVYLKYAYSLAPKIAISEEVEVLPGATTDEARRFAIRATSITSLAVQVTKGVGIKWGLTAAINPYPAEGAKPYDITTTVNVVASQPF